MAKAIRVLEQQKAIIGRFGRQKILVTAQTWLGLGRCDVMLIVRSQ